MILLTGILIIIAGLIYVAAMDAEENKYRVR